MNLDEAQRKKVVDWIGEGLKLSEIQNRLTSELNLKLTYMEVRMLVDDLKVMPKDVDPPKPPTPAMPAQQQEPPALAPSSSAPATGGVKVSVDQITRPGAMVSGKVVFSDGKAADWYLDQTGRLGLMPKDPGYRPPAADIQQFQAALEAELAKQGL
jgi:hypothetical protein